MSSCGYLLRLDLSLFLWFLLQQSILALQIILRVWSFFIFAIMMPFSLLSTSSSNVGSRKGQHRTFFQVGQSGRSNCRVSSGFQVAKITTVDASEIPNPHHLGWKKTVNNGINCQPQLVSRFQPSTVGRPWDRYFTLSFHDECRSIPKIHRYIHVQVWNHCNLPWENTCLVAIKKTDVNNFLESSSTCDHSTF